MKIRTNNVPESLGYLTNGKIYEGVLYDDLLIDIIDDEGDIITVRIETCAFLRGRAWEVVDED